MKNLIIIGELFNKDLAGNIIELAERTGSYIVADITSNLRFVYHPQILNYFDLALLNQKFRSLLSFTSVIYFGDRFVSKRLLLWLAEYRADICVRLNNHANYINPQGIFEQIDSFTAVSNKLALAAQPCPEIACVHQSIKHRVVKFLDRDQSNEAYYAARLITLISEPVNLFVSSSMPIRDLDQFAPTSSVTINIFSNRGASGIDGVLSTAIGVSLGISLPTILLIGDIAFLHDTNGLMLLKQSSMPILIILINNRGGGIFHFLPIADDSEVISPYIDTPHGVEIKHLCAAHGVRHYAVDNSDGYQQVVAEFFLTKKTMVLEVSSDREHNVALHKEFYQALSSEL